MATPLYSLHEPQRTMDSAPDSAHSGEPCQVAPLWPKGILWAAVGACGWVLGSIYELCN
jgi:hypothetical protein